MLLYRDASRSELVKAKIARIGWFASRGDALGTLVEIGELEQGLADVRAPERDRWEAPEAALAEASRRAGVAVLASEAGAPPEVALCAAVAAAERALIGDGIPDRVRVRPPEGFVHYALDPVAYARAAARYLASVGSEQASKATVIGVRSIGTALAGVVAAAVGSEHSLSVRPRGESGARRILAEPSLVRQLASWLAEGGDALVVDEGPGATGETFQLLDRWLRELGAAPEQVVLFPSRTWGMALAPPERVAWFAAARKFAPDHHDPRVERLASAWGLDALEDLSAGRWRAIIGVEEVPADPTHERAKVRARTHDGGCLLLRYSGLGAAGEAALRRAELLAGAGVGPPTVGSGAGFLLLGWVPGEPVGATAPVELDPLPALGRYLEARATLAPTGEPVDPAPLLAMLAENAAEVLGPNPIGLSGALRRLERLAGREAVVPDGRMQPWEWVRTATGLHKTDALDHGDGMRLPGPTDRGWDLAGAATEWALSDRQLDELAAGVARSGERDAAALIAAARACRPAYVALALAEATFGGWEAAEPEDRRRWECRAAWLRQVLEAELSRFA